MIWVIMSHKTNIATPILLDGSLIFIILIPPMNLRILLLCVLVLSALSWKSMRRLKFTNRCSQTLWVGAFAVPLPPTTGWEMKPGA